MSYVRIAMPDPIDPLLAALVDQSTADAERSIERLMGDAVPIIDSVVRRRCRGWRDIGALRDEVRSEAVIRLLRRLRTLSRDHAVAPIARFADYVAVVASRVVDDLMRRDFPVRAQLKNRLRYLLRHDRHFKMWKTEHETLCELTEPSTIWERRKSHSSNVEGLAQRVIAVLRASSPCELDALVTAVADATGVSDEKPIAYDEHHDPAELTMADPLTHVEAADRLSCLWNEIVNLPPNQRAALLLNLRDGGDGSPLVLLPLLGLTSVGEIATNVGLTDNELLAIWDRLPLQDSEIAGMLSITRQQVINLRKSARARLSRRMAKREPVPEC